MIRGTTPVLEFELPFDTELIAEAKIRHRGSRTCIAAVELRHTDGTVVCDGQFSYSKI